MRAVSLAALGFRPEGAGREVEHAFCLDDGRVLTLGIEDDPWEETLTVALFAPDGRQLARRRLGGSRWPEAVAPAGPRALDFEFPPGTAWRATVAAPDVGPLARLWHGTLRLARRGGA